MNVFVSSDDSISGNPDCKDRLSNYIDYSHAF